jgi:hypothetical protein
MATINEVSGAYILLFSWKSLYSEHIRLNFNAIPLIYIVFEIEEAITMMMIIQCGKQKGTCRYSKIDYSLLDFRKPQWSENQYNNKFWNIFVLAILVSIYSVIPMQLKLVYFTREWQQTLRLLMQQTVFQYLGDVHMIPLTETSSYRDEYFRKQHKYLTILVLFFVYLQEKVLL